MAVIGSLQDLIFAISNHHQFAAVVLWWPWLNVEIRSMLITATVFLRSTSDTVGKDPETTPASS